MFPLTRGRKTKTNMLATECAFYSADSIPRRLNLWFTQCPRAYLPGDIAGKPAGARGPGCILAGTSGPTAVKMGGQDPRQ